MRSKWIRRSQTNVSIYIPCYYDSTPDRNVQTPCSTEKAGCVTGQPDTFVKVRYYLAVGVIYRQKARGAAALARRPGFQFNLRPGQGDQTAITFKPTFRSAGASELVISRTAFHNTTFLRNNRGVY